MTRSDDLEAQVLAALEERTERGNGWVSLPSPDPIHDVLHAMKVLEEEGILHETVITVTPSEDEPGWWEILLIKMDLEDRPSDQVDVEVVG